MCWVKFEALRIICPAFRDVLIGCEALQGFEASAAIVGGYEVGQMSLEMWRES